MKSLVTVDPTTEMTDCLDFPPSFVNRVTPTIVTIWMVSPTAKHQFHQA